MKRQTLISLLMLLVAVSVYAQPSYSSYDTIPSYYRGYHYTEWYYDCPAYSNGGIIDSCNYEEYYVYDMVGANPVKYEYTDHPINIKGLVAMVDKGTYSHYRPYNDTSMGEQYLYLLERIDWIDTVHPRPGTFRMKKIDSVRFDTVKPKIMVIDQAYDGLPDQYVYVYEAYFDKPIQVDSVFYIYGTKNPGYNPENDSYGYWPFHYAQIRPWPRWLGCGTFHCDTYCHSQGQNNSMEYMGYIDLSFSGYPHIDDVWCMADHYFPDDPYGVYFAIVDHYELKLFSDSLMMGYVEGAGFYDENATAVFEAIPNPGYAFSHWNDGSTQNPRSMRLTQDTSFTAFFSPADDLYLQVSANNPEWGTVEGEGIYPANSVVTITATPNDKYLFDRWSDGNWQNPRTVTLTQDTSFTAIFDIDPSQIGIDLHDNGIDVILTPNPASGTVTVASSFRIGKVELYDLNGKRLMRQAVNGTQGTLDLSDTPAGTYIVRIGTNKGTTYKKLVVREG